MAGSLASMAGLPGVAHAAAPSGYVPMSALINGDSVTNVDGITDSSNNPISLEQYAAQKAGFNVTVVNGATWDSMTASDFAKYQLLIEGDPNCGSTASSFLSNASTWAPVVMGTSGLNPTVGNRAVIGTDPEFHYAAGGGGAQPTDPSNPSTAGAEHLVQSGITYAGAVAGATGVYFDTSCGDPGTDTTVLNSLSGTGTGFTENTTPPCGGSVQLIASNPAFTSLTDTDIQGWGCSDHITFPTYPTDWQPLAVATDTATVPTCGTDPFTNTTACGQAYVLVAGQGIVVTAPDLSLSPTSASDPAGGSHTVTATVTQGGSPLSGQLVTFTVTGQNAGASGTCAPVSCQTDSHGQVTFTYSDGNGAGVDTINASVTISATTEHATASETWTAAVAAPTATSTQLSGGGKTGTSITVPAGTPVSDAATLTGANVSSAGGTVTYKVFSDSGCTTEVGSAQTVTVTGGSAPASTAVSFPTAGTYYWTASYGGDTNNAPSASTCGSEVLTVTPVTTVGPSVDSMASAQSCDAATAVLSTTQANDLLVAFVASDSPYSVGNTSTVTGGGLTWTRIAKDNHQLGDAEVWTARATGVLTSIPIKAKVKITGYDETITVVAFKNATGTGAVATHDAPTGAPTAGLTTTAANSLVFAVGDDWLASRNRTVGPGQTLVHQATDSVGDTYWIQSLSSPVSTAGTAVTINDTAPTHDPFNMVVVEIK
ncbi:MAG: Ig-like domain repeat protein [Acidimicrobiaceae bacterium]|nr:Ig-like domain repeat protein [Acidimicrobiaceae bacterium]